MLRQTATYTLGHHVAAGCISRAGPHGASAWHERWLDVPEEGRTVEQGRVTERPSRVCRTRWIESPLSVAKPPGDLPCPTFERRSRRPRRWPVMSHVSGSRALIILEMLEQRSRHGSETTHLCGVAQEVTGLTGAAIALQSDGHPLIRVCSSSPLADALLDLEVTVGEGPCTDAVTAESMVGSRDLSSDGAWMWPWYAPIAVADGARAVFGFPIRLGAIRLGGLLLFRDVPGPLTDAQSSYGFAMATVAARAILALQAGLAPNVIAHELLSESSFDAALHQAAGMVSLQGAMSIGEALVALRAHAFVLGISTAELSRRVVDRRVAYDDQLADWRDDEGTGTPERR